LNVNIRVCDLKVKAGEEKAARIESTLAAKQRLAIIKLELETQSRIEALKIEHSNDLGRVLDAISQKLRDFCDFHRSISEKSVFETLDRAIRCYQRELSVIELLKREFEVDDSKELSYAIAQKISRSETSGDSPKPVEVKHVHIESGWQNWANRLAVFLTDHVSVGRTAIELQNLIEESLLHAIGSRSIWKTVDTLRAEKKLLEGGITKLLPPATKVRTFRGLLALLISVCRIQRLSGHIPGEFTFDSHLHSILELNSRSSPRPCFPVLHLID
jgi:hypothetical protein